MPSPSRLPSVPFPESTPTHPLLVIDYAKLTANDAAESARLFHAATTLGFWYLKNHGVDYEDLFDVGEKSVSQGELGQGQACGREADE